MLNKLRMIWRSGEWLLPLVACVLLPIGFHLVFSRYGLTLVDDGYILQLAHRVASGQIPHRDFVSIRPVFSAVFYAPLVLFAKDWVFFIARLWVWFQWCVISFLYVRLIVERSKIPWKNWQQLSLIIASICLSVNIFPIMVWHTIDGIFFASIGLFLLTRSGRWASLGALILGLSAICKQNFLPLIFIVPLVIHGRRCLRYVFLAMVPAVVYVVFLGLKGGWGSFIQQMHSQSSLLQPGVLQYIGRPALFLGAFTWVFAGMILPRLLKRFHRTPVIRGIILAVFALLPTVALGALFHFSWTFPLNVCFALFGALLVMCGYSLWRAPNQLFERTSLTSLSVLILAVAWCSSISLSSNTPASMSGPFIVALLVMTLEFFSEFDPVFFRTSYTVFGLTLLLCLPVFFRARSLKTDLAPYIHGQGVYLSPWIQGTRGILGTPQQAAYYADLHRVLQPLPPSRFVLLPDLAGFWVRYPFPNPFSHDFPIRLETNNPDLLKQLRQECDRLRAQGYVFVLPKYYQLNVFRRHLREPDLRSALADEIRRDFERVSETEYFEIYR